jgi:hypothetical protein
MITPKSDGSFDVTVLVKGTFETHAGAKQPGAEPCGPEITGNIPGTFYGDLVIPVPAEAEFNPYASYSSTNPSLLESSKEFMQAYFGTSSLGEYAWQFHYEAEEGKQKWDNTKHGNKGNITG